MSHKMKNHKSLAKRFKVTGTGKLIYNKGGKTHLMRKKNPKHKRTLRQEGLLTPAIEKRLRRAFKP